MNTRKKIAIYFFVLFGLCFMYATGRSLYVNALVSKDSNKIERQTYLAKYDLSLINYDDIDSELDRIEKDYEARINKINRDINKKYKHISIYDMKKK